MPSGFSFRPGLILSHLLVAALAAYAGGQLLSTPSAEPIAAVPQSAPSAATDAPLFRVGERTYAYFDLPLEYRQPLYQIRKLAFEQQLLLLEEAVVEAYIQQRIHAQGSDRMTVQNQLMPGAEPSDAEIEAFYAENRSQASPPLAQIRSEIHTYLTAARQEQLKRQLLTRLLVEQQAQLLLEAPRLELATPQDDGV